MVTLKSFQANSFTAGFVNDEAHYFALSVRTDILHCLNDALEVLSKIGAYIL